MTTPRINLVQHYDRDITVAQKEMKSSICSAPSFVTILLLFSQNSTVLALNYKDVYYLYNASFNLSNHT